MKTTQRTLSIFWQYTKRYPIYFTVGTVGSVLGVLFQDIFPPFIVSRAFALLQTAYATGQPLAWTELLPYVIAFIISMVLALFFWRIQGFAVWQYEIRAQRDLIVDIFKHLTSLGQKFHANSFGGALVSQVNKFVSSYERMMDEFTWSIMTGLTAFLAALTILFIESWRFALILLGIVMIYIVIMSWRVRHQFPYNRREAVTESARTAALADAVTNISNVRAFAHEAYEQKRFRAASDVTYDAYHKLSIETFVNDSISQTMTNGLRIAAFAFGIFAVVNLNANASILYLVVSYTTAIVDRLWLFGRVVRNVNRSLGDSAEMTEILQLKPEIADPKKPERSRIRRGQIEFKNVNFAHDGNDMLYDNLSLKIKPGEKIGLVGPSGSGKTTLTNLLLRFVDIQGGQILIDGQDITKIRQTDLRQHITYVSQEPILFHRSIRENISYGQLDASQKTIRGVARMAHADSFIESLPQGYDAFVGERGVKLSGGQRQRIAIARAMLKNAPILVLDEATSALDSESEALIQDALWKLMQNRTAIIIAHRLSTIQKMDRIVVLDKGKIVEQGSHNELLRLGGVYAQLWNRQSGGFIEE